MFLLASNLYLIWQHSSGSLYNGGAGELFLIPTFPPCHLPCSLRKWCSDNDIRWLCPRILHIAHPCLSNWVCTLQRKRGHGMWTPLCKLHVNKIIWYICNKKIVLKSTLYTHLVIYVSYACCQPAPYFWTHWISWISLYYVTDLIKHSL